ncbi:MAG: HAMP domain-containing histidine kinase [Candidatus Obscuribacterales bacterium]|nr:HAMP domain-containing histidine kinase [Candidatus Obscuribacterales bacterium]
MHFRPKLRHKVLALIAIPLAFELFISYWLYSTLQEAELEIKREAYAKKVVGILTLLSSHLVRAGVSLYVYNASGDSAALNNYEEETSLLSSQIKDLSIPANKDPAERERILPFEITMQRGLMYMEEARQSIEIGDKQKVELEFERLKSLSKTLSSRVSELSKWYQKKINTSPEQQAARRLLIKQMILFSICINLITAIVLTVFFNRNTARRLSLLVDNTNRFANGDNLAEPLGGSDEIAELDAFFHKMATTVKEASRRKQEFVDMIIHDLRNPLTSLKLTLEIITSGKHGETVPDKTKSMLTRSKEQLERIIVLINNLMDAEKFSVAKMQMHFDSVPVAHIFEHSLKTLSEIAKQKNIKMEAPTTDVELYVDPERIIQVLTALLSNALKFSTPDSSIVISLEDKPNLLKIKIKDNGPGVDPKLQDKLFTCFQQDNRSTSLTGSSLAICKEIIDLHKGTIGFENNEIGSTFWFSLPRT